MSQIKKIELVCAQSTQMNADQTGSRHFWGAGPLLQTSRLAALRIARQTTALSARSLFGRCLQAHFWLILCEHHRLSHAILRFVSQLLFWNCIISRHFNVIMTIQLNICPIFANFYIK